MVLRLLGLALTALACATPAAAETWRQVTASDIFAPRPSPVTVSDEGVTVTIAAGTPEDESDAAIVVQFPGAAPYRLTANDLGSSAYGVSVGIGRMAPSDPAPTVLLAGFTGGAHCCSTLRLIGLAGGKPVEAARLIKDGSPLDAFPADLDGDGTRDLAWTDGSLLYAFTSYASSWAVPRFYQLRGSELADVSRQPGFRPLVFDFAQDALAVCRAGDENAGACAAYAYAMAMQGSAEEGIRAAVALAGEPTWYPTDCLVDLVDSLCPEGKERQFADFEDALRWMMRENGYLP